MLSTVIEPRTFVKQVPLPIPSHRGIAIQARNSAVYNATVPTRDEIRKENYQRRSKQLDRQGFWSAINRPYEAIGEPVHLEERKLILSSLGQLDGYCSTEASSSDESGDTQYQRLQWANLRKKQTSASDKAQGVLKQNEASELFKEVNHGRDMVQRVKKGDSIFKLVHEEQQEKIESKKRELLKKQELMRTQMQPAQFDTDSELDGQENEEAETEGEFDSGHADDFLSEGDTELRARGGGGSRPFSTGVIDGRRVVFLTEQQSTFRLRSSPRNSSRVGSSKHVVAQRPYTPQHTNISASELSSAPDRNVMETEAERKDRNRRMNTERTMHERQENEWKQFISGTADKKKRRSPTRVRGYLSRGSRRDYALLEAARRRDSIARRDSVSWQDINRRRDSVMSSSRSDSTSRLDGQRPPDASSTCSDSQSSIGQLADDLSSKDDTESTSARQRDVLVDVDMDQQVTATGGDVASQSKLVDTSPVFESSSALRRRSSSAQVTATCTSGLSVSKTTTDDLRVLALFQQTDVKKLSRREKLLNKINRMDEEARWQRPRDELAGNRATTQIRPRRTASVIEFESTAQSNRYSTMPQTMQNKFHEVVREKEHVLNDKLEALFRERMKKIENKFAHKSAEPCVDVALQAMRSRHMEDVRARKRDIHRNKKTEMHHKWYTDLLEAIPDDIKDSWYLRKIMAKLEKFGLVEAGKQSPIKMLRVLAGLRPWEICSPDVSASIEFCRQRIVEMPVEEYEKWFGETFPDITRPPVVTDTHKDNGEINAEWLKATDNRNHSRAIAKSAPPRFRQIRN